MTEILLKRELEPLARQRQRYKMLVALAVAWGVVAVIAVGVFALSRYYLPLATTVLVSGVVVLALIAWGIAAKIANRSKPDFRDLARKIETSKPELHTLLLTAVEQERDKNTGQLGYLQERLIGDALGAIKQEQNLNVVPRRKMFCAGLAHAAALIALLAILFTVPRSSSSLTSLASSSTPTPAKTQVSITPGNANVERGSALVVLATFEGPVPSEAVLVVTTNGGTAKRIPLTKNLNDPVFGASIPNIQGPLGYRIEYSAEQTAEFKVTVFEHPRLERADANITYPAYTELPPKRIEDTKRVSAVEGSTVELTLNLNKPVASARLVGKDQSVLPLTIETNKAQVRLDAFKLEKTQSYELQLVDADGRSNKLATTFTFDALTNARPTLKFIAPRGDQRVSPLQEMFFNGEAQDDFGLKQYGLTYSVGGADGIALALGSNAPAKMKTNFTHLLRLEDIRAEVDQFISYYIWADDIGPDGQLRRTSSDMYFAEVRPFEQIFRESENMQSQNQQQQQQQQGQQQGQSEAEKLGELQKQIINATWKLQRQETGPKPSESYLENEPVILQSQQEALAQAESMDAELEDFKMKEALQSAIKSMEKAAEHLTAAKDSTKPLPQALAAEQAAYQSLLKLQAREFQVQRQQQQQAQSQQSRRQQQQQSQINQLDLKQQENRYEQQNQASAQQEQDPAKKEQLEQLSKLKDLAQRQQDINEKLKEIQAALQEAKTEQEKEELERELKRLREEQREMVADLDELQQRMQQQQGEQSQSREAQQQMEQTRQQAQQASEAMEKGEVQKALASGTRAERELEKMRDEARQKNSSQFSEEMKQMRNNARELAEKQEDISKKLDEAAGQPKALSDQGKTEELTKQLAEQRAAATNLLNQMKRVTDQAEVAEPLLSKQLYDSLRKNSQGNLDQSLAAAEELTRRSFLDQAKPFEERANQQIQNLKTDVERAAESVLGDETEALRTAKRELDALTEQLQRELARAMATNRLGSNALAAAGARGTNGAGRMASTNLQARAGSTNAPGASQSGTNAVAGGGRGTNDQQLASAAGQQGQQQGQPGQNSEQSQQGQGQQGQSQQAQNSQQGQPGQLPGQQGQAQQGQGQQQAQQGQPGQQGQGQQGQGQQGQGQQGQQAQNAQGQQGQQPGQQGQQGQQQAQTAQQGQGQGQGQGQQGQPGQQQAQQNQQQQQQAQQSQQAQRGQGQGQGQGQPQQTQAQQPGEAQEPSQQPNQNPQPGQRGQRANELANLFNQAGPGTSTRAREGDGGESSPLTGDEYGEWSQRLSNVEEMVDRPELRNQIAQARDRARAQRSEFKRHAKPPQWDLVQKDILKPLLEIRERLADELSRRESKDSLAPIDRDPVPGKYSDLVKRYYEKLGQGQ
jgi:hypothetical protein